MGFDDVGPPGHHATKPAYQPDDADDIWVRVIEPPLPDLQNITSMIAAMDSTMQRILDTQNTVSAILTQVDHRLATLKLRLDNIEQSLQSQARTIGGLKGRSHMQCSTMTY